MDKKNKLLLHFLKLLSKKNQFKEINFEKFKKDAIDTGFKDFSVNHSLFSFYNENVSPEVKWEEFDLSTILNSFYDKIYLISKNYKDMDNVGIENNLGNDFVLGYSHSRNYVDFYDDSIHIAFENRYSSFLAELINLEENDVSSYYDAKYNGNCFSPDYSYDELEYIFRSFDTDCRNKLVEILIAFGELKLANEIKNSIDEKAEEIVKVFERYTGDEYIDRLFREYRSEVENASCQSIIDAFNGHFNNDVSMYDSHVLKVSYDFFLNFLREHPEIQNFSDLKGHHLIDDYSNIDDAKYEYELSWDTLHYEFFNILDKMYDDVLEDEDVKKKVESVKEFETIMKSLKFKFDGKNYVRDFKLNELKSRRFIIITNGIDFDDKKINLIQKDFFIANPRDPIMKEFKIPFDEIADYVMTEKLHESIKNKIRKYLLEN